MRRRAGVRPDPADPQPRAGPRPARTRPRPLAGALRAGQLVVIESTTYPGTTRERLAPMLEESGLVAGEDFNLAFSPERVDPGRTDFTLRTTPKVVGGLTPRAATAPSAVRPGLRRRSCASRRPEVAELTKLLENIFRSVNIALVNELAILCDRMGDRHLGGRRRRLDQALRLHALRPGPGHGRALPAGRPLLPGLAGAGVRHGDRVHRAGRQGQPADALPLRGRRSRARSTTHAKSVRGSRIAVLGVSYKPGVGDVRESPALKILPLLSRARRRSALPRCARALAARARPGAHALDAALDGADVAVIVTAHPDVDHDAVAARRAACASTSAA